MLRYQEDNELHRDFHGSTNNAIEFISRKYGVKALKTILRQTGRNVYKSIHDKLLNGDASELIEYLNWFYFREGASYRLDVKEDEIRFEVFECPALKALKKNSETPSKHFCLQTTELNAGMCENTPWSSSVEILEEGHCVQYFRRKQS